MTSRRMVLARSTAVVVFVAALSWYWWVAGSLDPRRPQSIPALQQDAPLVEPPQQHAPLSVERAAAPRSKGDLAARIFRVVRGEELAPLPGIPVARTAGPSRSLRLEQLHVLGRTDASGTLVIPADLWRESVPVGEPKPRFVTVLDQAVYSFREVGEAEYLCHVSDRHSVRLVCIDDAGLPLEGVEVALSKGAVPRLRTDRTSHPGSALADTGAGDLAIYSARSDASGQVAIDGLEAGHYAFDAALRGFACIGGRSPDRDHIAAPGEEVRLVFRRLMVCIATLAADEILSMHTQVPKCMDVSNAHAGRDLRRAAEELADRFPTAALAVAGVPPGASPEQCHAYVKALIRRGTLVGWLQSKVPFVPWSDAIEPSSIPVDQVESIDAGRIRVTVIDGLGNRYDGLRCTLESEHRPASGGIVIRSGAEATVPAGDHLLFLRDLPLPAFEAGRKVSIAPGAVQALDLTLPEPLAAVAFELGTDFGDAGVGGVSLRLRQDGTTSRIVGGDSLVRLGPFWQRLGVLDVDVHAPGYGGTTQRFHVTKDPQASSQTFRLHLRAGR
jgi:hypothetical protein